MPVAPRFEDLQANYLGLLPVDRNALILDFGCGGGRVLEYLNTVGYRNFVGVDRLGVSGEESNHESVRSKIRIERDPYEFLKSHSAAFDRIIAKDVVYYFPKPEIGQYFGALFQALKPGGKLIVEIFNGATFTGPYVAYKDLGIQWIPTEVAVLGVFRDAGFRDVVARPLVLPHRTLKRFLFNTLGIGLRLILRLIFLAERGIDSGNPTIFSKKIVIEGTRPPTGK